MTSEEKYRAATRRADERRAAFFVNVERMKIRVAPSRLKADALAKAKETVRETRNRTVDTARAHPFALSAIAATALAYFARKPVLRFIRARRKPKPVKITVRKVEAIRRSVLALACRLGFQAIPSILPRLLRRTS